MPETHTDGVRRALIIGINAYADNPLDGCIPDAKLVAELLRDRFDFADANITLLFDRDAALDKVYEAFDSLIGKTSAGDTAFIYYAGHGSRAESDRSSEASGQDSTLNLCEDPREDLFDFEIGARLEELGKRTQFTVMVVDACHSGTISRSADVSDAKARFSPPAPRSARRPPNFGPHVSTTGARSIATTSESYTLIAACRDDEIAKESGIPGDDATRHGALTYALVKELQRSSPGQTWRDVFERIAHSVNVEHAEQHPQIEGNVDRELFGLREFGAMPYLLVSDRARKAVVLGGGALHGVTSGAVYTIYPAGTKSSDAATPLGTVVVTAVLGATSRGRILSERKAGTIVTGTRAAIVEEQTVAAALAMTNTNPRSKLSGAVTLDLLLVSPDGSAQDADVDSVLGMPIFETGDRVAFRISSTADIPLYVNLFEFDTDGGIAARTKGNANQLAPRGSFEIGVQDKRKFVMKHDGDDALTHYKLFASVSEVDLSYLTRIDPLARGGAPPVTATTAISDEDWTTVTRTALVRRKIPLTATGGSVTVGGATVEATGLAATIRSSAAHGTMTTDTAAPAPSGALSQALANARMTTQQSLVISDARVVDDGTRDAGAGPSVQLQVPDLGDGFAQVVMTTDASGRIGWHFAPALDTHDTTRDGIAPSIGTRTFTIAAPPTTHGTAESGERGVLTAIGQKLIDVYAFPIGRKIVGHLAATYGEALELERTPYRVRSFTPDDYSSRDATVADDSMWRTLSAGRALLMIHGTNSRTDTAFGELPKTFVQAMHGHYDGRVFAFDHPTLTHDPKRNIETLIAAIPDGLTLDVDIICHSRGGLVSRVLSEKQGELALGSRNVRVGSVVFVGAPNAGTRLADDAFIGDYLDTLTTLLNVVPTNGVTDALGFVLTGVKLVAMGLWEGLAGLRSMQPGGDFATWMNVGDRARETRYFALTSNFTPAHPGLVQLATDRLMDKVFQGAANDLVVPTEGVYAANGSGYFPIAGEVIYTAADAVPHTGFFQYPRTAEAITGWLTT